MRSLEVFKALCAAVLCCTILAQPAIVSAQDPPDVLISAGHEGRPDCDVEPATLCNNTGAGAAPGEITWTPIVADEATRILRAAGVNVLRKKAALIGQFSATAAVFIHFDGAEPACSSAASVGFPPNDGPSHALADAWKKAYANYWPYGFQGDNFTEHLSTYYGYHHVATTAGRFVVEFGEMSCPKQNVWLGKHLKWEGALLAYVLSQAVHKGNVPDPGPPK